MVVLGQRRVIARSARYACREAKPSSAARAARCWSVVARRVWAAVTRRGEGLMPAWSSRWRTTVVVVPSVGAGRGVIHALGVPGAPPLREIPIDEVPAETCAPSDRGEPTRMGESGLTPGYRIRPNPSLAT